MKLGVSRRSKAKVSFARCAGALSCWKMKKPLDIPQIAGNIFSINRTFLYYSPLPSPQVPRSINVLCCAHRTWSSAAGLTIHAGRFSNLSQQYIEAICIPTLLRELFYQPTTTVTLQQY